MKEKKRDTKITRITVDFNDPKSFPKSTLNKKLLNATGEKEIAKQKKLDYVVDKQMIFFGGSDITNDVLKKIK